MKKNIGLKIIFIVMLIISMTYISKNVYGIIYNNLPTSETKYDQNDNSSVFPDSYKQYIKDLKAKYPNWTFKAVYTKLDWNQTVNHESYEVNDSISTIPSSYSETWKKDGKNYYKDGSFVIASKSAVAYCLDPRNFLTEYGIFQFDSLNYTAASSDLLSIEKVLSSTVMGQAEYNNKYKNNNNILTLPNGKNYFQIIQEAGQAKNVSPVYIASRIKQETGGNILNNSSINGSYPGYLGIYNFYNIGATPNADGSGAIANGLAYAKNKGWTNPEIAIKAGVEWLWSGYIKYGQNTVYFQKFDVNNPYGNAKYLYGSQFMTNIAAPSSESQISYNSYKNSNRLNSAFEFNIPVYNNMPASNAPYPGKEAELTVDKTVSNKTNLNVSGWMMAYDFDANIEIYIDDKKINPTITRTLRPDVISAVNGYGGITTNPKPGFETNINLTNIANGYHTVIVKSVSKYGRILDSKTNTIFVNKYDTFVSLDEPVINQETLANMQIKGWVVCESDQIKIQVKLNNSILSSEVTRLIRPDVIASIGNNFGGITKNPKPGFAVTVDSSNLPYSNNNIVTVEIIDTNTGEVLQSKSNNVITKKYESFLSLDSPNTDTSTMNNLKINGWVMCEDKLATLNVYVDGIDISSKVKRTLRPDVIAAVSGFGGVSTNSNPGFETIIDKKDLTLGNHTVLIQVKTKNGKIVNTIQKNVNIQSATSVINIDVPFENSISKNTLTLKGWSLVTTNDTQFKVYLNDKDVTDKITRKSRTDVLQIFDSYEYSNIEKNKLAGFEGELDIRNLVTGTNKIVVEHIKNNIVIDKSEKKFIVENIKSLLNLDVPSINLEVDNSLQIKGWIMSDNDLVKLKVFIDDKDISSKVTRTSRSDVIASINGFGGVTLNPTPGFEANIDTNDYFSGYHNLRLQLCSPTGKILIENVRKFKIKKGEMHLNVDLPSLQKVQGKNNIELIGWYMSTKLNTHFGVYIDEVDVTNKITRKLRPDVLSNVKGYGDSITNPTPGFEANLDVSNLKPGEHTLRISSWFHTGEKVNTIIKKINIEEDKAAITIDQPTQNQIIQNTLNIKGWVMCNNKNSDFRVYVDGILVNNTNVTRIKRPDVIANVKGYGDETVNLNPGFEININLTGYSKGEHIITALSDLNGNILQKIDRKFLIN